MQNIETSILGHERQVWYTVSLLTAGHFFSDFYANFLPAVIPIVIHNLGLSLTLSGLLVMLFSFTSSILQPIFGYFVDRYGFSWLILVTLPVSAIFISLIGVATRVDVLFLFVAISGLASSLFHPLATVMTSKVSTEDTKAFAISIFIGGGPLGFALAPAILMLYIATFGLQNLLWMAIPGVLLTLNYYFQNLHTLKLSVSSQVRDSSEQVWYKSMPLLTLNIVMGLRAWSQVAVTTFLPILLTGLGYSSIIAGSMLTVFLLGGVVGGFVGGYLTDKIGYKKCMIAFLLIALPTTYLFLAHTDVSIFTWIMLAISGAVMQGTVSPSIIWAQSMIPSKVAMASGMMLGLSAGLGGVGAAITGAIADYAGIQSALLYTLFPLTLSVILACFIPVTSVKAEDISSEVA